MEQDAYIYFMSNKSRSILYLGVTNNLIRRVAEHKAKVNQSFSKYYNCDSLVYYEAGDSITAAIDREKQIKNWNRSWKDELIESFNPSWRDLSAAIGVTDALIDDVAARKEQYREEE